VDVLKADEDVLRVGRAHPCTCWMIQVMK
jgi:hypothetical protein